MTRHELKAEREPFAAVLAGRKHFEWRWNDRDYAVGDQLVLNEWDPAERSYSGRSVLVQVTHMMRAGYGLPAGFVILSIERIKPVRVTCE